jgi:nitrate/nitrite-specific signal transduction histidine kinase
MSAADAAVIRNGERRSIPAAEIVSGDVLRNAFCHAQAAHIEAEVTYGAHEVRLRIRDDGKGIDTKHLSAGRARHWGLAGMRERAAQIGAQLNLWSEVGAGTEVELHIRAPWRTEHPVAVSVCFI